jgi:type IV pilus assembly protein PilF
MRGVRLLNLALVLALATGGCALQRGPTAPPGGGDWVTESDEPAQHRRARLRLELASAYYQQGQDAVALDEVKRALAAHPGLAPAWNLRGLLYLRLAQWSLAEDSFKRALELAPRDPDAAHNYGWMLCQHPQAAARHAESVALMRQALAQPAYAQAARTWTALAWCQQRAGRLAEADASLMQAQALAPDDARLDLMRAQLQHARGQWVQADAQLARLHARQPASAESLWLAIRVARKLDNQALVRQLASQLRQDFGRSPQAVAYDKGLFNE